MHTGANKFCIYCRLIILSFLRVCHDLYHWVHVLISFLNFTFLYKIENSYLGTQEQITSVYKNPPKAPYEVGIGAERGMQFFFRLCEAGLYADFQILPWKMFEKVPKIPKILAIQSNYKLLVHGCLILLRFRKKHLFPTKQQFLDLCELL